jgi:hypothetical protein
MPARRAAIRGPRPSSWVATMPNMARIAVATSSAFSSSFRISCISSSCLARWVSYNRIRDSVISDESPEAWAISCSIRHRTHSTRGYFPQPFFGIPSFPHRDTVAGSTENKAASPFCPTVRDSMSSTSAGLRPAIE